MAYRVTIYSAAERVAHAQKVKERGRPCADMATFIPAHRKEGFFGGVDHEAQLSLAFLRPEGNLCSRAEWIDMLESAVRGCHRKGESGRGLSQAEFVELAERSGCNAFDAPDGFSIPMSGGWRRGIKEAELKTLRKRLGW